MCGAGVAINDAPVGRLAVGAHRPFCRRDDRLLLRRMMKAVVSTAVEPGRNSRDDKDPAQAAAVRSSQGASSAINARRGRRSVARGR